MLKNKKLSRYKISKIIDCFCLDICAAETSQLVGINRNTTNRYFTVFRKLIFAFQLAEKERLIGKTEADGSFLKQTQTAGIPGSRRDGHGKMKPPVLIGIYERNGRVFTELVPDRPALMFQSLIHGKRNSKSMSHADTRCRYDGLTDFGGDKYYRVGKDGRLTPYCTRNREIETFWGFAKQRFRKLKAIKKNFDLHLKECEWRYNKPTGQLVKELLKLISISQLMMV